MSAIFGILRHDGQAVSGRDLDRMSAILAHRGRDGRRIVIEGPIGVGHGLNRVNIEDFHEAQPLVDPATGLLLVADIRLDNREEIAASTETAGDLSQIPDSELLLAAYRHWGEACVDHLIGDFTFALWDRGKNILLLGRDHMGQRGLFYHHGVGFTAFASEVRALWAIEGVPRRLSEEAIGRQLLYPIDPNDGSTLYEGIGQLTGGTLLRVGAAGALERHRYWSPHAAPEHVGHDEAYYVERYRAVLGEAVACRVRRLTRAPGLLFSGGFDSGSIAALAGPLVAAQGRRIVAVASVLAEGKGAGARDARAAVRAYGDREWLDLNFYVRGEEGFFSDLETSFGRAEESVGTPYVRQAMYKMVAQSGARLVMDGMGGDYTLHVRAPAMVGRILRGGHFLRYGRELIARRRATARSWRALILYDTVPALLPLRLLRMIAAARRGFRPIWRTRAVRDEFAKALFARGAIDPARLRQPALVHNRWQDRWLHLLRKASAAPPLQATLAASSGLDFTRPFHDRRIVEFALAIPPSLQFRDGVERYLARRAVGDLLPRPLLDRPPGNDPEEPDLFRMAHDSVAGALEEARLADRSGRASRFVDFDKIETLIADADEGRMSDHGRLHIATRAIAIARFIAWFDRSNE